MDGVVDGVWEFIHIPDGKAASLASKAAAASTTAAAASEKESAKAGEGELETPVETKMYKVDRVYGQDKPVTEGSTKMYKTKSMYDV